MDFYKNLPTPPEQVAANSILCRFVDSIGHRFYIATEGLTEKEFRFRPTEESMNIEELMNHLYRLLFWAYRSFNPKAVPNKSITTLAEYRCEILQLCQEFRNFVSTLSDQEIEAVKITLRRTNSSYPVWYLINGPLADALTHVGQLVSWRRIAGNPISRISYLTGESY